METYTRAFPKVDWALVLAWIGVVMISSLIPTSTLDRLEVPITRLDLVLHMLSYGMLAILLARALDASGVASLPAGLLTITGVLALGGAIEVTQPIVGRAAELADWLADGVGAIVGLVVWAFWRSLAAGPA